MNFSRDILSSFGGSVYQIIQAPVVKVCSKCPQTEHSGNVKYSGSGPTIADILSQFKLVNYSILCFENWHLEDLLNYNSGIRSDGRNLLLI